MIKRLNIYMFFPVLLVLMALVFIAWAFIIPMIKNNINYLAPENLSVEETVEYYFDSLNSGLPKKAASVFYNDEIGFNAYELNDFSNIKAENIKIINEENIGATVSANIISKEHLIPLRVTPMWSGSVIISLEKQQGNWKIKSINAPT